MILADKIYFNGHIYTMEQENAVVEAVAIYRGYIAATGSSEDLMQLPAKEYIDLKGKTVLPGFADTHMHLYQDSMDRLKTDLQHTHSVDEILEKLRADLHKITGNNWLFGENVHADYLKENRLPTRRELDTVSSEMPIMIGSFCRHTHVLNSKALEICEIEKYRNDIPEDMMEYETDGSLNGSIKEWAFDMYIMPKLPVRTTKENMDYIDDYLQYVASQGLTQLHAYQQDNPDGIMLYEELRRQKGLKCRITFNFVPDTKSERNIPTGFGDDYLKIGATKYLIDGSLGAASALMYEDYEDLPGERGIMTHTQEELNAMVKTAYDAGNDVAVHAIGDRANDMVLTAFENAWRPELGWNRRFYIIHATMLSKTFIERAKKLPIILNVQPVFIRNFVNLSKARIGAERDTRLLAFKTMLDNGLIVASGSDAPVRELNPFNGIQCAVTRRDIGGDEVISVHQEVSVYEAICMYTKYAAYCAHEEDIKGTLTPGKVADMIVLDTDPFYCAPDDLHKIRVEQTILGGKTVFYA